MKIKIVPDNEYAAMVKDLGAKLRLTTEYIGSGRFVNAVYYENFEQPDVGPVSLVQMSHLQNELNKPLEPVKSLEMITGPGLGQRRNWLQRLFCGCGQ